MTAKGNGLQAIIDNLERDAELLAANGWERLAAEAIQKADNIRRRLKRLKGESDPG